jgi:hypothetical protein
VAAVGSCVPGSLVAARVRGLCTVLVTKSGAVEDCQSWRIQSRTRELPFAIVMLTLYRNSDFCLRAAQPEPPASSSFSRSPSPLFKGISWSGCNEAVFVGVGPEVVDNWTNKDLARFGSSAAVLYCTPRSRSRQ